MEAKDANKIVLEMGVEVVKQRWTATSSANATSFVWKHAIPERVFKHIRGPLRGNENLPQEIYGWNI